jgi:hypothetical protein
MMATFLGRFKTVEQADFSALRDWVAARLHKEDDGFWYASLLNQDNEPTALVGPYGSRDGLRRELIEHHVRIKR